MLSHRAAFGVHLTNMHLLNLGLTQINLMLIAMLGGLSLNYLTGCAGLISIGHAAFYATGAMTAAIVGTQLGFPFPIAFAAAAVTGAWSACSRDCRHCACEASISCSRRWPFITSCCSYSSNISFASSTWWACPSKLRSSVRSELSTPMRWYFFLLPIVAVVYWMLRNSLVSREGRAMRAMRDHELAATAAGIDVRILRLKAFAFSSAIASAAGALQGYFMSNITSEAFGLDFAIQFIAMIIIGGLGSLGGSLVGAAIWLLLPSILSGFAPSGGGGGFIATLLVDNKPQLVQAIFGLLVILLLIFAPGGVAGLGRKLKELLSTGGPR